MALYSHIKPPSIAFGLIGIAFASLWLSADNYSLEIDDITARVRWRKVRTGHVRYLREFGSKFLQGPRLELSERGPLGARFFGVVVVVPKGLPDYEQIKKQVSTWMAEAESHTEK